MVGPVPASGRAGVADSDPGELGREVVACWDEFLDVVRSPGTDLSRRSRLAGWSGREVLVHLGHWEDSPVLDSVVASARTGRLDDSPPSDRANDALVQAHRDDSTEQVVAALQEGRDRIAAFFDSGEAAEIGRLLSRSTVGPLPVLSLLHAATYELAVHALDLAPCGAPRPATHLLDRGLAALVDVTGSLAARSGVEITLAGTTPDGGWQFSSGPDGWSTERHPSPTVDGVGVHAPVTDLLDASAGRTSVPQLLLTRRMHVTQMQEWMRLAPLVDEVPGLPGGAALRTAVSGVSGVVGGVGRVLGRFRR
ncbi:hypothetical protein BH24ACT10_BH24ACT10_18160 [soil metagenome]